MYVKNDLNYKIRNDLSPHIEGTYESLIIEIMNKNKKFIIGEIYRPPNTNEHIAINNYEETLSKIQNTKLDSIIGTDQNFDYLKIETSNNTQELLNTFLTNSPQLSSNQLE